jgi:hypothetical protein
MSRQTLLRLGAFFILFTFAGHTVGTFMEIPPEQVEVAATHAVMERTQVPMPMGSPKSYAAIFHGNSLAVSLYLLVTGLAYLLGPDRRSLTLHALGMGGLAALSAVYFFPVPAVCTGLAAALGLWAAQKVD